MKKLFVFTLVLFLQIGSYAQEEKAFVSDKVKAVWKTSAEFKVPESVFYCRKLNVLFVSNINGQALVKDGNGFISKLTTDGNIIKLHWVEGLNAPKGMGVYKERLFVADIDRVAEIDISLGKIIRFYDIPGAEFLNDLVIAPTGEIYVSDMKANKIYRIYNGVVTEWLKSEKIIRPNGLGILGKDLFIGTKQKIVRVNMQTRSVSDHILNTGSIDGLICLANKQILYSDWKGNVYIAKLGAETEKLIDTTPLSINAADIGFNKERNILLVPTFYDNRIMAYQLKE